MLIAKPLATASLCNRVNNLVCTSSQCSGIAWNKNSDAHAALSNALATVSLASHDTGMQLVVNLHSG
jgi:hypothetical protein